MDNHDHEKESYERRNSNTEYVPTKCRVTRPPPPKPATNPLQFIKVAPPPLFKKAQEQIKKIEEIKKERKEIRDEAEDWQQNLDNWKSCRRKRQEHIIERVVEVKKLTEQEELEKSRKKSKTFSEMLEERSQKGRPKVTIPIYNDDDSNDLSDYGIGSSSSKTNSIKDADTDDSSSLLDEKDHQNLELTATKDISSPNQSQSEDETTTNCSQGKHVETTSYLNNNVISSVSSNISIPKTKPVIPPKSSSLTLDRFSENNFNKESTKQYTYEGAIQDYRSRIQNKMKVDESIFIKKEVNKSKEFSEAQMVLPKGEISKRKGLFETSKSIEIVHMETTSSRRLSEDFANAKSLKDRLKSLESATDQSLAKIDKNKVQVSVKERLANCNNQKKSEFKVTEKSEPPKISSYLLDKSNSTPVFENCTKSESLWKNTERCSSPETEMYMNKLNMFNRDLNSLMGNKSVDDNLGDFCASNSNYPPSTSSIDLTGVLSDREDSGIHTADVSCSVSQADEPIDTDNEAILNTIPNCIEKLLKKTEEENLRNQIISEEPTVEILSGTEANEQNKVVDKSEEKSTFTREEIISFTKEFLDSLIKEATEEIIAQQTRKQIEEEKQQRELEELRIKKQVQKQEEPQPKGKLPDQVPEVPKPVIYENIEFKPLFSNNNLPVDFITADFTLSPLKLEPPKVRPPPPPPEDAEPPQRPVRRLNSTKRIKKEMHSKRSSFLGLDDTDIDLLDPDQIIEKPPDINTFLQKEQKLEKSLYKKMQEESKVGLLSKVESQDSGLDIDRGRLSSDTWCSSVPSHDRQDSEHTNSITSEEDEITKKEREIIEMVEKEEKSRDKIDYVQSSKINLVSPKKEVNNFEPSLGSEKFNSPYFPEASPHYLDDQDSEVLKVERELRQLEQEELDRQRENILFRESRNRARLANRHSLENICDDIYPSYANTDYRKSLPDLQRMPLEFRKSISDVPSAYYENTEQLRFIQSTPDIQHTYRASAPEQRSFVSNNLLAIDHRKSMPELQHDARRSAFISPPPIDRQPIKPSTKPLRTIPNPKPRILTKPSLKALSAVPRNRHTDNWITPKAIPETKNYNQHWVYQEAELRRLTEQQQKTVPVDRNSWQQGKQEKPLPDSVIQTITQRVQNRNSLNERNQPIRRNEANINKDYNHHPIYVNHPQTVGHAMPSVPFSPPAVDESLQDRMLSVSGKKKCSYCSSELGRGAAMIIESLCLFYHMECFKCCVCHIQLGDGRIGTDVRVRNQKLHCHNCYSSDDGVKFSCV